jgi:predicted Zn-dependent protease
MRQTEEEADRLAVVLASAASYDLARAEAFMARLLENADGATAAETHPAADRRLKLLGTAIAAARGPSPERQQR